MDNVTFVTTSLKYFDENNEKYEGFLKNAKYVKYVPAENEMSHNIIKFFDKNKMEIFRSRYEIIGLLNTDLNSWTWSWALPNFKKINTGTARKLLNYGLNLDPSAKYLKTELITSRFRIADLVQLDIHIAIASYMSKNPFIYKYGMARYSVLEDGTREISNEKSVDSDGFIILNPNINETIFIYYMFLLDYEKLNENNQKPENECDVNFVLKNKSETMRTSEDDEIKENVDNKFDVVKSNKLSRNKKQKKYKNIKN